MAFSIPEFYSCDDYTTPPPPTTIYSNDFFELPPPTWGEETSLVPLLEDFGLYQPTDLSPSQFSSTVTPIDQQDPVALPQLNTTTAIAAAAASSGCLGYQFPDYEFGDDCFGLVPDIKPINYHPLPSDNWEIQNNQVPVTEDSNMKVGRYSEEVRKERILRYLKKRNQRNFNKTIKYACRKTLADRRIRVRGRFARNNEACDQQLNPTNNNDTSIHKHTELLYNHDVGVQMRKDEEEWVQEITSLMYLPYISS